MSTLSRDFSHFVLSDSREVRPAKDGNQPGRGESPGQADHQQGPLLGPLPKVLQGGGDGPVSGEQSNEIFSSIFLLLTLSASSIDWQNICYPAFPSTKS